jgi:hypothetical protein
MTTRKILARLLHSAALAAAALTLGGCATPGPLHVYSLSPAPPSAAIRDTAADAPEAEIPSFLAADDELVGFAYDPFTDHFFLRLAPGNVIRVVDRPARAVKRTYTVGSLPNTGGGDLAVRPHDGRIFFTDPAGPALILTDRFGNPLGHRPDVGTHSEDLLHQQYRSAWRGVGHPGEQGHLARVTAGHTIGSHGRHSLIVTQPPPPT